MLRHVAVGVAAIALLVGCLVWLGQQAPHRPAPARLAVSVAASPGAFDEAALEALRQRSLAGPGTPCSVRSFGSTLVSAQLSDITAPLRDSVWEWQVSDRYAGPVLVRGVDGSGSRVGFQVEAEQYFAGEAGVPLAGGGFPELTLNAPEYRVVAGAVRARVEVRFPAPGCYVLQVDGLGFQEREVLDVP
jgi:hypothetical protein